MLTRETNKNAWRFLRKNVLELSYLTEKRTLIRDWRLALLYYGLLATVLAYVCVSLFSGKSYIMTEIPTGASSAWGSGGNAYARLQEQTRNSTAANNICTNLTGQASDESIYKFYYDDEYVYDKLKCGYFEAGELISKLPSGNVMFFATHVHETLSYRYTDDTGACNDSTAKAKFNGTNATTISGTVCKHFKEVNYLVPGMENSRMSFDHSYSTVSNKYEGTKPKTYIRKKDSDVNEYEFAEGSTVTLTMKEWLDLAGVDLDKPFDEQPGSFGADSLAGLTGVQWSANKYPTPRLTGVRLNILVRYFNYELDKTKHEEVGTDEVYAVVTVSPRIGWFSKGNEIQYRPDRDDLNEPMNANGNPVGYYQDMYKYGILFDIQQTGLIGALDPIFVILTLTSGLVLLNVASSIVNLVAKFLLGDLSKQYKQFIQEECDIQLEAARYTAMAIVASRAFKHADTNGEGVLDFTELKEVVKLCFADQFEQTDGKLQKEIFGEQEIHAMTLFLMRAADPELQERIWTGNEKSVIELENSTISLNAWQELSTGDYIDHKSLKGIIQRNKAMKKLTK
jgi:hypothetical protein